jgi:F-type H+-transporting ATPase subunit b
MPQLETADWAPQLIWLAITFIFLYLMMARVALPRIANVLEQRRDRIASDLDQAAKLKMKTEEAIAAYEQSLAEARARSHAIAQEMRDALKAEMDAERAKLDADLTARTDAAEARIASAKGEAMSHVNAIAAETAQALVEQLIGVKPAKGEAEKAVGAA